MNDLSPPPQYVTRDGDALRDRDTVLSIWHGNLGQEDRIAAKYEWFYLGCPFGPPVLQLLHYTPDATDIGTACAGRRRMLWRGEEIRAGVLVDLTVTPAHRSLGPALILQQGLIQSGRQQLDLLYGFPNPKAAAVFKRIGYEKFTDIVRHAHVLRHAGYLRNKLPAWLAVPLGALADMVFAAKDRLARAFGPRLAYAWSDRADPAMDRLWRDSEKGSGLLAIRDSKHCKWRFDDSPLVRTRYLFLTAAGDAGMQAWFATQVEAGTLHVRDFWSAAGRGRMERSHLLALLCAAREAGHASVSMEIAADDARLENWKRCGFVERSRRPVFGRWSRDETADPQAMDLFLTSADEDE
ncbi:hypothetical protein [Pseudoxanthomonas sacheonensis]|uniref:hypothetical protein n=1 Tax=Pseudoxanthomonas sacheonensis TaxID=443615 RepID=UPI0013D558B6|nr:hypothetical protein [Pseudoxanthomonas sacheonensis]KAF1706783.1 hypothetical protein CSC73_14305 [Pseudoxanthomonas sacheonensis]